MEEFETAISVIEQYINECLFEPNSNWPVHEFNIRCYSRWASYEILERIIRESERLPEYITGKEVKKPLTIIKEFIFEMEHYSQISNDKQNWSIFYIAKQTAIEIILLFL